MTIYTASREPILLAGRLTSTGFKRKPPKQKPKKAEPLAMGFGFYVIDGIIPPKVLLYIIYNE
ncbi:hypothetical protein AAW52_22295 [Vibrio diabolicus]|nr:hypothetical protein AAW52_22295 [Vibrio diabolicus]